MIHNLFGEDSDLDKLVCNEMDRFVLPIKSSAEVERAIRFIDLHGGEHEDINGETGFLAKEEVSDFIRYLHPELGQKQNNWKDEDFKEEET